jgi:prevent-host-death family protein
MTDLTMTELEALAGKHTTRQASEVKSNWRSIVQDARKSEVIVTSYSRPEAVVMSVERYAELQAAARSNDPLRQLRAEFDRELAGLRAPGAAGKLRKTFAASPKQIAAAANAAADADE